jgi:tetratricopeptide (TPR) repeat protein
MKRHLSFIAAMGICFFASISTAHPQVRADTGSIAIGGSVTGSTVIIGISQQKVDELVRDAKRPLEELTTQQRENIALLKEKLDLNERQVRAALGILGENDIAPERLSAKLVEIAERFKDLQATASAQPGDDPKIVDLKAEAQKAIEAGDLTKADALLAQAQQEQARSLDRLAVNAADTFSRRGEIAFTRLRYAEAAKHFANAAAILSPHASHDDKRINYLQKEAGALHQQGYENGDNGALLSAIDRRKRLVELLPRERVPLEWAKAQNNLGFTLWRLGERESGTEKLEEAVATFREALKELTRERVPLDWARTEIGLGLVLWRLGRRENGTAKLEEAAIAYREALKEWTRERVPLDWAMAQDSLGTALADVGRRESGTAKLEEAVAAYREALKERTRERVPLDWATTQNNLGTALDDLGRREIGTAKLEEAVAAYREVLKEATRERVPLEWAGTQHNLGTALAALGRRQNGTARLEEDEVDFKDVVARRASDLLGEPRARAAGDGTNTLLVALFAFRQALKEWTRERVPLEWAGTQNNLGLALAELGRGHKCGTAEPWNIHGTAPLEEAAIAYREALKEWTRERVPLDWAMAQNNLGNALHQLWECESRTAMRLLPSLQTGLPQGGHAAGDGTTKLEEAVAAYREALKERTRERVPLNWAISFGNEGIALMLLADRREDAAMARTALSQINAAVETLRDDTSCQGSGCPGSRAAYYERQLPRARAIVARLRER